MIERFLEALFRYKWLILAPPILIPLIVGPIAVLRSPVYYDSWAGIWVDRPTYLSYNDDWNQYITPAQNQSGRLAELLRTRAFLVDLASRTALAPLADTPQGDEAIRRFVGRGVAMYPNGSNLLVLRFRAQSPQLSFQMLNALLDTYKEKAVSDRISQAGLAMSFYEGRLQTAEESYSKANEGLRRYVAANPRLSMIDPDRGAAATTASRLGLPASAIDPQLAEHLRRVELEQSNMERARASLEQARLDATASLEGQELGFQVVDPPLVPEAPTQERRKALVYPAAGLLVGMGLSAVTLVLLVAADRTVRSESDLMATARMLGTLPELHIKRLPKQAGADAIRRAIGFAAGTSLPALPAPSGAK
jgi:uncharacterized protein involved in exopolysaccharide biosynthesis